ncbi:hypothetical protein ACFVS2_25310 [Brevibacillus sp. NPDC058079]|uniref:hypothetical protein n=1 Tax=Brevibacillus sp. NPDC058079 TaxID=3346330 RepID=UPI0036E222EE
MHNKDRLFRNIHTGRVCSAYELGKSSYEEAWKEQKERGEIPEDSSDFHSPSILSDDEYIESGASYYESDEDYTEILR